MLSRYAGWRNTLIPVVCGISLASALALILIRLLKKDCLDKTIKAIVMAGFAALLIAPAIWSYTPIIYGSQTTLPIAGPELSETRGGGNNQIIGNISQSPQNSGTTGLIKFLLNNKKNEKYLVAVPDANSAASIILETGEPVMAVGGFLGTDNILTVDSLKKMVKDGELRYFEVGGRGGNSQSDIITWVKKHGTVVSSEKWTGSKTASETGNNQNGFGQPGGGMDNETILYDLTPKSST
jgi:4-amino-4-deoxy-L-arabinose transferase-like glycosyltransferase